MADKNDREFEKFVQINGQTSVRVTNTNESKPYQKKIREKAGDSETLYIGWAETGAATSEAVWRIKRLVTTNTLDETWADGDQEFNNIFDNRESLDYS